MEKTSRTTLQFPEVDYGIEPSKHKLKPWVLVTICYALLVGLVAFLANTSLQGDDNRSLPNLIAAVVVIGFAWLIYTYFAFGMKDMRDHDNRRVALIEYATTTFKTWIFDTYGVNLTDRDAVLLYDGHCTWIETGQQVRLDGSNNLINKADGLMNFAEDPKLVIMEVPKHAYREYEFPKVT